MAAPTFLSAQCQGVTVIAHAIPDRSREVFTKELLRRALAPPAPARVMQRRLPASAVLVINFPTPSLDMVRVHLRVIPSISLCADPLILPLCLPARLGGAFEFKRGSSSGCSKTRQGR